MKALITGASSGIGRDMARVLAKKGYDLVLIGRNVERLEQIKNELKESNVQTMSLDLSIKENCIKLHQEVKDVDILINNAGFAVFGKFIETDLEKELTMINTNVTAVHILTKLYLKDMQEKNSGRILNVASVAGFMPGPLMDAYYASKSYVIRLSQAIKAELKRDKSNVKISVLCPGPVDTNFNNVAGVKFNAPSLSSEYVAKYSIDQMFKNKFMILPGKEAKLLRIISKFVPSSFIAKCVFGVQERKTVPITEK